MQVGTLNTLEMVSRGDAELLTTEYTEHTDEVIGSRRGAEPQSREATFLNSYLVASLRDSASLREAAFHVLSSSPSN